MSEATFPVRLFETDQGRWYAEVYHDATMQQSWDSGEYDTWEEALEAAKVVLDEAFHTALYYSASGCTAHHEQTFARMRNHGRDVDKA